MSRPVCYTSSSIGHCPDLSNNFLDRPETVSITWDDGFHFEGDDSFLRVFHQCEPPEVLDIRQKLIENHSYYDLIMAFDERVLRECPNAVFLTESACSWLGRISGNVTSHFNPDKFPAVAHYEPFDSEKKKFAVSFLTSSKNSFPGHHLRHQIYDNLANSYENGLEVWKHKSPPRIDDKKPTVEPYMFSIAVENSQHNGYYTEKIVDCFIAKTIPIYWGCPNIGNYFNREGIIEFTGWNDLLESLYTLNVEFYHGRRNAIEENYRIALKSVHQWDLIENYISEAIYKKKNGTGFRRQERTNEQIDKHYGGIYRPLRRTHA